MKKTKMIECFDCGRLFPEQEDWRIRCIPCYLKYKREREEMDGELLQEMGIGPHDMGYDGDG